MKVPEPDWIVSALLGDVRDGSIVLMHMPDCGFREHVAVRCFREDPGGCAGTGPEVRDSRRAACARE
eukprot:1812608-Prymnesium_polylepis.2